MENGERDKMGYFRYYAADNIRIDLSKVDMVVYRDTRYGFAYYEVVMAGKIINLKIKKEGSRCLVEAYDGYCKALEGAS